MCCDISSYRCRIGCFNLTFITFMYRRGRKMANMYKHVLHVPSGARLGLRLCLFASILAILLSNDVETNPGPPKADIMNELKAMRAEMNMNFKKLNTKVDNMEIEVKGIAEENFELKKTVERLEAKVDYLDNSNRQRNVIFYNVDEADEKSLSDLDSKLKKGDTDRHASDNKC